LAPTPATILFVDDDSANRQTLGWLLCEAGYRVLEASSGAEALSLAREQPDLVLLDINLPDFDGYEVCRRLRELPATRHAAVVQMSAVYVGSGDRSQGLEQGADAYLVKPVEPRELLAQVRALLRVRAAEEASRRAAQEWRATFDAIGDAVCLLDKDGRVLRCNRATSNLVGQPFDAVVGRPFDDVLREGLRLDSSPALAALAKEAARESREVALGERWFHVTADPIHDDRGGRAGSVHILEDVTPRVRLEEQLRQSQRLEAVGRLAGGVAHDFNNLLTAILGNASLLMRMLPEAEAERDLAATIERAAWRAAELTRQLLGFSRQALLWLEAVEGDTLLDQVAEAARRKLPASVRLVVERGEGLWPVQADAGHLGQVLTQLCLNAIDAMPDGGTLTLSAGNEQVPDPPPYAEARPGPFLRLSVADSGVGIAPELVDKVFDPFFTTKPTGKGSGLGLAMVHGVVKQHQGWVRCASQVGCGTRFDLHLPRWQDKGAPPDAPAGPAKRVLLADDNEILRALAATYLRQAGFEVLPAGDGREAVELFRREHPRIDLVILDEMTSGLSGADALAQMRQVRPDARGLLIGGQGGAAAGSLEKPYRERDLLQVVRSLLADG
jgi:two-component system, cell cycle sensor histidine kinase and response regulator CckA